MNAKELNYDEFLKIVSESDIPCAVLSSINFEECSIRFSCDLIRAARGKTHLAFTPFRLESRSRASPWSALEIVKKQHQTEVELCASEVQMALDTRVVEHPVTFADAFDLIQSAIKPIKSKKRILIIDISAMPRELASHLLDIAIHHCESYYWIDFDQLYIVHCPPERLTSRSGLGPFSVGAPTCIHKKHPLRMREENSIVSALIFPGVEGFEARACIDLLAETGAHITVAVNCFDSDLIGAMEQMIANQSIFFDAVDKKISIQYYFSDRDALRVGMEAADRAARLAQEFQHSRHAFLVAPFASKWTVAVSSMVRKHFVEQCKKHNGEVHLTTDVLTLSKSQYVSLHSRGATVPRVLHICDYNI